MGPSKEGQDLLVKVRYTAFDTVLDYFLPKRDMGASYVRDLKSKPLILGYHYVGTVVEKSLSVTNANVGDVVYGHLDYKPDQKQGTLSEYILVTTDGCVPAPKGVEETIAAASTTESLTALQALRDEGGLGASSVVAVCGTKDVERVR